MRDWSLSLRVLADMKAALLEEVPDGALVLAYNVLESSCQDGRWDNALALVEDMHTSSRGIMPDGYTYSSAIASYVNGKEWLQLLEDIEGRGVRPTVVSYNSVIEALDAADVRSCATSWSSAQASTI